MLNTRDFVINLAQTKNIPFADFLRQTDYFLTLIDKEDPSDFFREYNITLFFSMTYEIHENIINFDPIIFNQHLFSDKKNAIQIEGDCSSFFLIDVLSCYKKNNISLHFLLNNDFLYKKSNNDQFYNNFCRFLIKADFTDDFINNFIKHHLSKIPNHLDDLFISELISKNHIDTFETLYKNKIFTPNDIELSIKYSLIYGKLEILQYLNNKNNIDYNNLIYIHHGQLCHNYVTNNENFYYGDFSENIFKFLIFNQKITQKNISLIVNFLDLFTYVSATHKKQEILKIINQEKNFNKIKNNLDEIPYLKSNNLNKI